MDRKKRNIHRKGTDPAFQTGKTKKYKRAKPENKEMTDIKNPFPLFTYEIQENRNFCKKRRLSETNVLIVLALYPFRDSTAIPKVHAVFEFALTAATKKIVAVSP